MANLVPTERPSNTKEWKTFRVSDNDHLEIWPGVHAARFQSKTDETKFIERHTWHEKGGDGDDAKVIRKERWFVVSNPDAKLGSGTKNPLAGAVAASGGDKKVRGRKATGAGAATVFGYSLGPFVIWAGTLPINNGYGYYSGEVEAVLREAGVDVDNLKPSPNKYINDRLWRGRFGKNGTPADVDANTAEKVAEIVAKLHASGTPIGKKPKKSDADKEAEAAEKKALADARAAKKAAKKAEDKAAKEAAKEKPASKKSGKIPSGVPTAKAKEMMAERVATERDEEVTENELAEVTA